MGDLICASCQNQLFLISTLATGTPCMRHQCPTQPGRTPATATSTDPFHKVSTMSACTSPLPIQGGDSIEKNSSWKTTWKYTRVFAWDFYTKKCSKLSILDMPQYQNEISSGFLSQNSSQNFCIELTSRLWGAGRGSLCMDAASCPHEPYWGHAPLHGH